MLEGKPTFVKMHLDVEKYKKDLRIELDIQMRQAAREWLRVLLTPGLIPIWTGTSRGVFTVLGTKLRISTAATPEVTRKGRGALFGSDLAHFYFIGKDGHHTFEFVHTLGYLTFNDQYNANEYGYHLKHPGPYRAFEKASVAFNAYINANLAKKLPKLGAYELRDELVQG